MVRIETESGTGSGAIYETDGEIAYIVTNHHVIEGNNRVRVTVKDRDEYQGDVLGTDSVRDLAVVRICCGGFSSLPFGDAFILEPGDEVVNIGYALGMRGEATISRGIVSAIRYDADHQSDVIQTDAAINPGNSGGPMLSLNGEILGINTFKISETDVEGLGFAISAMTARRSVPALQLETAQPVNTPVAPPRPDTVGTYGFGPLSGELRHNADDDFIETHYANVSMADMAIEATFTNPYSSSYSSWDYGFMLRENSDAPFIHIVVSDNGVWSAKSGSDPPYDDIGEGALASFFTGDGERNHLRLVAIGDRGWFFVNNQFVAFLDLSDVMDEGDVAVITGAFTGDEVDGKATRFENFRGWRPNRIYGPADGILEKESGFVAEHDSGIWTRDLVVEAEFISPQDEDWDYGFIIRSPDAERLEVVGITGFMYWFHKTRDIGDGEYADVSDGWLSDDAPFSETGNHLLLIAVEEYGWLFLNDDVIARLDLSHNMDPGGVHSMGNFFFEHESSPAFRNFNVWMP